jgi:cytochrome c
VNVRIPVVWIGLVLVGAGIDPAYAQDVAKGEHVYANCAPCHAKDSANGAGPGLRDIVGRKAGTAPGFHYSRAMKNSKVVWDQASLDSYIASPQKAIPGNVMPFSGIADAKDRTDLITYLGTLK